LNYLNTSVFFPEIVPLFPTQIEDEINSLFEFIADKCMDSPDDTPEDEDDDIPDGGKFGDKTDENELHYTITISLPVFYIQELESSCFNFYHLSISSIYLHLFSPPPEVA
jgi:hypothetical protein